MFALVVLALTVPTRLVAAEYPADIARDLEVVAASLDESLRCLTRDDAFSREVLLLAHDLRLNALWCVARDLDGCADKLNDWAARLEQASTKRWYVEIVRDELTSMLDRSRLRELAAELLLQQERIDRALYDGWGCCDARYNQGHAEPQIGDVPTVVVERGKTIKLRHAIRWRMYPEDELVVKLSASPSLTVPAELKLEFEKHSLEFEYEVKVGENIGESDIVLTPAVGQPVVVHLSVR
jgi:hypothetical protein